MTQIFNITHDAGNLDEYDSLVNDTDLSAETAAAMASTPYGLQLVLDTTAATYGQKNFTQLSTNACRYRIYCNPNTLAMANGDLFYILSLYQSTNSRILTQIRYDGTYYEIRARVKDDNGVWQETARYDITDDPHYIEVLVNYATGAAANDGEITLWIDGAHQETETGLDIYSISKPDNARIGPPVAIPASTSGIFYLDEILLRDDDTKIGPVTPAGFAVVF